MELIKIIFKKASEVEASPSEITNAKDADSLSKFLNEHMNNLASRFVHGRDLDANNNEDDESSSDLSTRFVHGRSIEDNTDEDIESSIEEPSNESDEE